MTDLTERFWVRVEKTDTCWLWTGRVETNGYGRLSVSSDVTPLWAHRYAYELHKGAIPEGLQIDHLCRVRHCVNPGHLEAVTLRENLMRGEGFGAKNIKKTHCPKGHEYTTENTIIYKSWRYCRTCRNIQRRARRATLKGK
jgi:hypothetical protein